MHVIQTLRFCLVTTACLSACNTEQRRPDSAGSRSAGNSAASAPSQWVVTPRGIGPVHAGMTRAEAEAAIGGSLAIQSDSDWKDCAYIPDDLLPPGVGVMIENGVVARVEIDSGGIATAEGARIGDTEDAIRQLYHGHVVVTPHKYTEGHYFTVVPLAAADSMYRIVFETDGRRVTQYRAGRLPAVDYVEGCG